MKEFFGALLVVIVAIAFSGCVGISSHTATSDDGTGKKTAFGLIGLSMIDNGYPLIPLYTSYEQAPAK